MPENEYIKKIFTVSLLGSQRVKCRAAFNGEVLVIQSIETISGLFGTWKKSLAGECQELSKKGFMVLVEERTTDHFASYGNRVLFDDIDPETNRTYQNIAMDEYFALTSMGDKSGNRQGNLVVGHGLERFLMNSNMVNVVPDEKGRNKYDIEYERFTGQHRAILLAVLGALIFNPMNDGFLKEFMGAIGMNKPLSNRPTTLQTIIDYKLKKGEKWRL